MNKYKESLGIILNKLPSIEKVLCKEYIMELQELVDKENPMKVIIQERVLDTDYYCPKCNGELLYGEQQYCDECGQKLYLEDDDNAED